MPKPLARRFKWDLQIEQLLGPQPRGTADVKLAAVYTPQGHIEIVEGIAHDDLGTGHNLRAFSVECFIHEPAGPIGLGSNVGIRDPTISHEFIVNLIERI